MKEVPKVDRQSPKFHSCTYSLIGLFIFKFVKCSFFRLSEGNLYIWVNMFFYFWSIMNYLIWTWNLYFCMSRVTSKLHYKDYNLLLLFRQSIINNHQVTLETSSLNLTYIVSQKFRLNLVKLARKLFLWHFWPLLM